MTSLHKKKIIIAGAAIGIGRQTAILLSKLGASLILIDIDESSLEETKSQLSGQDHFVLKCDLSELNMIESHIKNIVSTTGPIDGFVHCIGMRSRRPISMLTPEVLAEVMKVNFGSFIELVRCIAKKKNYNEGLSIVGVSSIASQRGAPSVTAYAASKAAIDGAVRCLAKELSIKKIRINTVVPAQIDTPAYKNLVSANAGSDDQILKRQYLGLGKSEDVANAIIFLLGNQSAFITGSAIPVDGGFLSS